MTDSGVGSSIMPSDQYRKWHITLPICMLVLTSCLLAMGHYQEHNQPRKWNSPIGTDWTPARPAPLSPTIQVAFALNFPALLLLSPLRALSVNRASSISLFLLAVVIIWYVVGLILNRRLSWSPKYKPVVLATSIIGLFLAAIDAWVGLNNLGLHYFIPFLGALLWAAILAFMCIAALRNATLIRT